MRLPVATATNRLSYLRCLKNLFLELAFVLVTIKKTISRQTRVATVPITR
jgi:hypothetical protein